ncbi:hypothetical protein RCL1_003370 [Eukaryota sp. TZLM3-RCL]
MLLDLKYQPVPRLVRQRVVKKASIEWSFWRSFSNRLSLPVNSTPFSLDFSPADPHDLIVASSLKISIFNSQTGQIRREISRFQSNVLCTRFNASGELIVGSTDDGMVRVFNTQKGTSLRSLLGHQGPVNTCQFFASDQHFVLSGGNDNIIKLWDLAAGAESQSFSSHSQYVKSVDSVPSTFTFVSGSHDGTVCLWDVRSSDKKPVMTMEVEGEGHVERVVAFPGGSLVAVGHDQSITIFDLVSTKPLVSKLVHNKALSDLSLVSNGRRLLSSGLDGHVKIFSPTSLEQTFDSTISGPVSEARFSSDLTRLAIACFDNNVTVKSRSVQHVATDDGTVTSMDDMWKLFNLPRPPKRKILLQQSSTDNSESVTVSRQFSTSRLRHFDRHLKNFEYGAALCAASTAGPDNLGSVLLEIRRRGGLINALQDKKPFELVKIIKGLSKLLIKSDYTQVTCETIAIINELYCTTLYTSENLIREYEKLIKTLDSLTSVSNNCIEIKAMIETISNNCV